MAVKSAEEIQAIATALRITEQAVEVMVQHAKPGVRVREVVGRMLGAMVSAGSDLGIQLLLSAAPRTPRVAGRIFPERALQTGDVIINEIAGKYIGYHAQMHAPVSVGKKPGPEYMRLWDVALAALNAGLAILRPGLDTVELAEAVRRPVRDAGLAANAMPLFKGMGVTIAEQPYSPHGVGRGGGLPQGTKLQEGMVILFEPAAYDERTQTGLHLSEQIVVTPDGYRRLGKLPVEFRST